MNNKSTQILLIIGIVLIIGGAVYASLNLVKKQPGEQTNTTNTGTSANGQSVLLNVDTFLKGSATFTRPFFVPTVASMKVAVRYTAATVTVLNPSGGSITSDNAANQGVKYSYDNATGQAAFTFTRPASGIWQVQITSTTEATNAVNFVVSAPTNEKAVITPSKKVYAAGEDIVITATATANGQPVPGTRWDIVYGSYVNYTPVDVLPLAVFDDGNHNDGKANDGIFGGTISGTGLSGKYHIEGDAGFPSGLNLNTFTIIETPAAQ